MFKYFHIINFLMRHDLTFLKKCWEVEFLRKKFTWHRLLKKLYRKKNTYIVWWRLANEMSKYGNKKQIKTSRIINDELIQKYNVEIGLKNTFIDVGFYINHYSSIVIYDNVKIGKNFTIRQNVTIGSNAAVASFVIGDNVKIGAGSIILGGNIIIGSNVTIGAMSFINNNIPDNCTVYTEKTNKISKK